MTVSGDTPAPSPDGEGRSGFRPDPSTDPSAGPMIGLLTPGRPLPRMFRLALLLTFCLILVLTLRQASSPDIGFHLRAGQHILEERAWPVTDPFSYTYPDRPYVDSQWGYQVLLLLAQKAGGPAGMVLFHAALALTAFFLLYRTARLGPIDPASLVLLLPAAVIAAEHRFLVRPEMMSWVFLAATLYILSRRAVGRSAPLWLLPVVQLAWVNTHSAFVLGWVAVACVLAGDWIARRRLDRTLLVWGLLAAAVTLINPYGLKGVLFPFELLTRFSQNNPFNRYIGELVSPFQIRTRYRHLFPVYPYTIVLPFAALLALAVPAAVNFWRRREYWAVGLFPPFMYLAAQNVRNTPLLVMACLPLIIQGLPVSAAIRRVRPGPDVLRRTGLAAALLASVISVGLGANVITDAYYLWTRRADRFGWAWNPNLIPAAAMDFVNRTGLDGPVLNHLNFGGHLMWATGQKTFIDGRLEVVGEDFFQEYERVFQPQRDPKRWRRDIEAAVARWGVRWTVFPYDACPDLLHLLSRDPAWRLAYVDAKAVIFVRNGPEAERWIDPRLAETLAPPPAPDPGDLPGLNGRPRPGPWRRFWSGWFQRQAFPTQDHMMGLFHYFRRELPDALAHFARAVDASRGYYFETYNNLGSTLYRLGRFDLARQCYEIVLRADPNNRLVRQRLAEIRRLARPINGSGR